MVVVPTFSGRDRCVTHRYKYTDVRKIEIPTYDKYSLVAFSCKVKQVYDLWT